MVSTVTSRSGVAPEEGIKAPCIAATTTAITLSGLQTIDGVSVVANDRVVVKDQADQTTNGIYSASSSTWSRVYDFNDNTDLTTGTLVTVSSGSTNKGVWMIEFSGDLDIGATSITFSGPSNLPAGTTSYSSVYALTQAAQTANITHTVESFYAAQSVGGGVFYWDSSQDKVNANGGTIIDPDTLGGWTGLSSDIGATYYGASGQGTGVGTGCWMRIYSKSICVEWFGATADGITVDDTIPIQKAYDSQTVGEVLLLSPKYLTTDELSFTNHRVNLRGSGQRATEMNFQPTATGKACFHFSWTSPSVIVQCSCKGFGFSSVGNTIGTKSAIRVTAAEEIIIDDIAIASWSSTGKDCIGFESKGFQTISMSNYVISADIPIYLKDNPNGTIDADHYHFWNGYTIPDATQPNVIIDSGVNITNLTFDGYQAWVGGTDGIQWIDTTSSQSSQQVSINNVRWESGTSPTGYFVNFTLNSNLQQFRMTNCSGALGSLGVKLRKVRNVTLANCQFLNTSGTAIDVDSTVQPLILDNVFTQSGSTISVGTLKKIYDSGVGINGGTTGFFVIYAAPTVTNQAESEIPIQGRAVSIAQDATATIGPTTNGPVGFVFISTDEDTGAIYYLQGASAAVAEVSDPGTVFTVTKNTASSYNIYAESGNYLIQNKRTGTHVVRWYVIGANI